MAPRGDWKGLQHQAYASHFLTSFHETLSHLQMSLSPKHLIYASFQLIFIEYLPHVGAAFDVGDTVMNEMIPCPPAANIYILKKTDHTYITNT